jgi:FkbM family methyltransferase
MQYTKATQHHLTLFYEALLGRDADKLGLNSWISWIEENNPNVREVAAAFISSPEFLVANPRTVPRALSDDLIEVTVNGTPLLLPRQEQGVGSNAIIETGVYEPHVCRVIDKILAPGSVFLDVGANLGFHSQHASEIVGADGTVYAVDASVENCVIHAQSLRQFGRSNVVIIPNAVGSSPSLEKISIDALSSNKLVRKNPADDPRFEYENVFVTTLDLILGHLSKVDLIKIDVEGREAAVVQGAHHLLGRSKCSLIAEYIVYDGLYPLAEGRLVDLLRSRGYQVSVIEPNGLVKRTDGSRKALDDALAGRPAGSPIDLLFTL